MNDDKAVGVFEQAKGKIKEALGNATGDEKLANAGAADQVKGHARETWGAVKDTASHLGSSTRDAEDTNESNLHAEAHDSNASLRDDVTAGAANLKDSIKRGLDHLERSADRR